MAKIKSFVVPIREPEVVRRLLTMFPADAPDVGKPDVLNLEWHDEIGTIEIAVTDDKGANRRQKFKTATLSVPVLFFEAPGGVSFMAGTQAVTLELTDIDLPSWHRELSKRNVQHSFSPPQELLPEAETVRSFVIHTGQEIDALERSAADGRGGRYWRNEDARGVRVYEPRGTSHRVELELTEDDHADALSLAALEKLTAAQDADFALAMLYVASTLAPPEMLPSNRAAIGWIDLTDVMEKIGWYPSKLNRDKAAEKRAQLWRYLVYGDRARVVGARSKSYFDRITKAEIPTQIESSIWKIMSVERPLQRALFDEVPLRVQVVISKDWEPLLTAPDLAQYLPLGEILGSIPPNKVAGDWARVIGLTLARAWRMWPREANVGPLKLKRRELLTHYTPKTREVGELLNSDKPRRAVGYWRDALGILSELGIIAQSGEAARTVAQMLVDLPAYNWQDDWLNEAVEISIGSKMQSPVSERAQALPPLRPKALLTARKKRGRPRKNAD